MIEDIDALLWGPGPIILVQELFGPDWNQVFNLIALLGDVQVVVFIGAVLLWMIGTRAAYSLVGTVLLAGTVNHILMRAFGVPRPYAPEITAHLAIGIPSFPSGHTVTATVTWGMLSMWGLIPRSLAGAIVAGVMVSRLYLGVHYLADLLGGLVLGLIVLALYVPLSAPVLCWFSRRSSRFFAILGVTAVVSAITAFPFFSDLLSGWQTLGALAGAGIAIPLQHRYVRYSPGSAPLRQQVARLLLGLAGLVGLLLPGLLIGDSMPVLGAVSYALAVIWALLIAPSVFMRLGLAPRTERPRGLRDRDPDAPSAGTTRPLAERIERSGS